MLGRTYLSERHMVDLECPAGTCDAQVAYPVPISAGYFVLAPPGAVGRTVIYRAPRGRALGGFRFPRGTIHSYVGSKKRGENHPDHIYVSRPRGVLHIPRGTPTISTTYEARKGSSCACFDTKG